MLSLCLVASRFRGRHEWVASLLDGGHHDLGPWSGLEKAAEMGVEVPVDEQNMRSLGGRLRSSLLSVSISDPCSDVVKKLQCVQCRVEAKPLAHVFRRAEIGRQLKPLVERQFGDPRGQVVPFENKRGEGRQGGGIGCTCRSRHRPQDQDGSW